MPVTVQTQLHSELCVQRGSWPRPSVTYQASFYSGQRQRSHLPITLDLQVWHSLDLGLRV